MEKHKVRKEKTFLFALALAFMAFVCVVFYLQMEQYGKELVRKEQTIEKLVGERDRYKTKADFLDDLTENTIGYSAELVREFRFEEYREAIVEDVASVTDGFPGDYSDRTFTVEECIAGCALAQAAKDPPVTILGEKVGCQDAERIELELKNIVLEEAIIQQKIQSAKIPKSRPWRRNAAVLHERLMAVRKDLSLRRLLEYAGMPDELNGLPLGAPSKKNLFRTYVEILDQGEDVVFTYRVGPPPQGGNSCTCKITMRDGTVLRKELDWVGATTAR